MFTRLILVLGAVLGVVLSPVTAAQAVPRAPGDGALTWSVVPSGPKGPNGRPALTYKLDPGATLTDHVAVTNHSKSPLTLRLYASDAFTTAGGAFALKAGNARPADAGSWVRVGQPTMILPSTSQIVVPITITVPANATPGDHAGGVVASLVSDATTSDGNRVAVDHRVGARIYLRVTGTLRPKLSVVDAKTTVSTSWNPLRLPTITTEFTVRNTGNVRLSARPSAEVHTLFGFGSRSSTADAMPEILPGGALRARTTTTGVIPLLRVWTKVDPRPGAVGTGQVGATTGGTWGTASWIVPWPQLVLLLLVAGLVAGWVAGRRRRRRRTAAALRDAERRGREQAQASAP